jgi:serine/threonine-protein kinase
MPPAEALAILRPVFQALGFAHEQRVTHRDVKPSNIMLTPERGGARSGLVHTRLLDFGIAKEMAPDETVGTGETSTHALVSAFSLPYASPEQKAGMKTGPWTDVHALGLILTEMLTGQPPYPGVDRIEIEQRVMSSTRPTPALFGVDVGPWEPVLAKAVALRSPDRFRDAGSLLAELEANLDAASRAATNPSHAAPMSAPPPLVTITDASLTRDGVSPSTLTGSPTTSIAPEPPSPRDRPRRIAAFVGGGVLLVALVGVTRISLLSTPTAPPSTAAVVSARPLRAVVIDAGSPASPVVVARPDDVPSPTVAALAPNVIPETTHAVTPAVRTTSRRHSQHATGHHAAGHRRPD